MKGSVLISVHIDYDRHGVGLQSCHVVVLQMVSKVPLVLQDEKQALHNCVRMALSETQNAAVADRAATLNGQEGDIDAAVNAQIQQRRNQKVLPIVLDGYNVICERVQ